MTGGDTIAALATAPGRGGVAVVRVSGSGADARIMIRFDDTRVGVKEFALSIAPIIKTEG